MGITDNLDEPWVSYHYGTLLGEILGVSAQQDTPESSPMSGAILKRVGNTMNSLSPFTFVMCQSSCNVDL